MLAALPWNMSGFEETYVVRPNDTLFGVARRFAVPVSRLAKRNDLSKSAWIYVGQRLIIPSKVGAAPAPPPGLGPPVQQAIADARRLEQQRADDELQRDGESHQFPVDAPPVAAERHGQQHERNDAQQGLQYRH